MVVKRDGCLLKSHPRHLTMVQNVEMRRQKLSKESLQIAEAGSSAWLKQPRPLMGCCAFEDEGCMDYTNASAFAAPCGNRVTCRCTALAISSRVANRLPRIGSLILGMGSKSQGQIKFTVTFHCISTSENGYFDVNGLLPSHTTLTN
ncbi:uncharacterized protein TNCV_3541861 [Trichonephila clavipes]|nr:uncharacterized protein TNCV_3541861 [Trichonephila clavipes]